MPLPICSNWTTGTAVLAAQEGKDRFYIDFRKVNGVTKAKDALPIPHLEDCRDHVWRAKYGPKIDLLMGNFYLKEPDRVLSFGMKNNAATSWQIINSVTHWLKNPVTYTDDIVTYSETWEQHLKQIKYLFE